MTTDKSMETKVTIVFGGDTSLGDAYLRRLKNQEYLDRLNFSPLSFFEALEPLTSDKDRFVLNLETVLADEPKRYFLNKRYCGWDTPERTIKTLKTIGVDAVSLANNHTLDFGPDRLMNTISALREEGIEVIGAGGNIEQASKALKIPSALCNIYILAAFEVRRDYRDLFHFYATDDAPGVNHFQLHRSNRLSQAISDIRHHDPHALIVAFPHWGGTVNYGPPTNGMWDTNEGLFEAGADLVLGHGAHNAQRCFASLKSTTAFSIGNFVFNSPGRYKLLNALPYSLIVRLEMHRSDEEWVGVLKLYPIISDNLQTDFRPRPVTEMEAVELFQTFSSEGKHNFSHEFDLQVDNRGWHIVRTMPTRRKLISDSNIEYVSDPAGLIPA